MCKGYLWNTYRHHCHLPGTRNSSEN